MPRVNIIDMVIGQTYSNVYLLKQHVQKNTKSGTPYLDMVIQDRTGEMPAKLWSIPASLNLDAVRDSDFIALQFLVEDYQGNKQAKILNIRTVRETDKFNKEELVPVAPEPAESMYDELMATAQSFNNVELQKVTTKILADNKAELLTMPGAKSMHHDVLGGLLYHTTGMLRTAKALCTVYPCVRKDLLLAGVILHDIAKLREFVAGPVGLVTDYSVEGKLLGHLHMGAQYVGEVCDELGVSKEINVLLQHMLLAHHGLPEWGSPIGPMFLEAELLHLCDKIDSRVYMYQEAIKDVPVGQFSQKIFALDNHQIYNYKWDDGSFGSEFDDEGLY